MDDNSRSDTAGASASGSSTAGRPRPSDFDRSPDPAATTTDIKEKLSDDLRSASSFARNELSGASEKVQATANDQKNVIATKISGIASAIEKVADELEQGDNREVGKVARSLGSGIKKFTDEIQDRSLGEIAGMAEDYGRKQPLAFLGLAAIAGLAASRFLTASAHTTSSDIAGSTKTNRDGEPQPIGLTPTSTPSHGQPNTEGRVNG
ncbi:hypothetical protein SAMN03159496_06000 [Rhizobium sp. NFR07]|uniref:hypothetical protein n=1 Tax=Rhizobium sp. NFR07 TaxID=1566262 RepID=UPI0008E68414|nr:hypothetical protein [Rhizobium sp. NFR07]SFB62349.1 hypothetical protein SAMN03159496_06000 [Rhizobium sp. NFR07]